MGICTLGLKLPNINRGLSCLMFDSTDSFRTSVISLTSQSNEEVPLLWNPSKKYPSTGLSWTYLDSTFRHCISYFPWTGAMICMSALPNSSIVLVKHLWLNSVIFFTFLLLMPSGVSPLCNEMMASGLRALMPLLWRLCRFLSSQVMFWCGLVYLTGLWI